MEITLRSVAKKEIARLLETAEAAFSEGIEDEDVQRMEALLEPKRTLAAFDGEDMVAAAAVLPFTLTIPGGAQVPSGGVTIVGVMPTHRRRGIVKSMMKRQLEQCRDLGEATAILWASEGTIYPNFGYGLAAEHASMDLDRPSAALRSSMPPRGRTRLVSHDEALKVLPLVYDRVQAATPGMFARSAKWWDNHRLFDGKSRRAGAGPMFRVIVEIDGHPEGYALYRARSSWHDDGIHEGALEVLEAMATNIEAEHTLWSFIFGVDLVDRIKTYTLPVDHPLKFMLRDMRHLRLRVRDAVWLRVVDVVKALEERAYATEGRLVFELVDAFCPWNDGVWELEGNPEGGKVRKSKAEPDLSLTAEDLGAVYLGGNTFAQLLRGGRIEERSQGAATTADDLFRTAKAPWCPEIF